MFYILSSKIDWPVAVLRHQKRLINLPLRFGGSARLLQTHITVESSNEQFFIN